MKESRATETAGHRGVLGFSRDSTRFLVGFGWFLLVLVGFGWFLWVLVGFGWFL